MKARPILRTAMAGIYAVAGTAHLLLPRPFLAITPKWVPVPATVIALTGVAELCGAIGLLQPFSPRLRQAAGWGLAAYALCVWPANVNHMMMDLARPDHGAGLGYHIPRMIAQPLLIWAALWASGVIEWPFRKRPGSSG